MYYKRGSLSSFPSRPSADPRFRLPSVTNYYQNHRRYVKSINTDQLMGKSVSYSTIDGGDCKPADTTDGKIIYPCGLIANSLFNGGLFSSG